MNQTAVINLLWQSDMDAARHCSQNVGGISVVNMTAPVANVPTLAAGGSLVSGTPYFWEVSAVNALGETIGSNEVTITPSGGNLTAVVTWAAVTGAASYKLFRSTSAGVYVASSLVASSITSVSYNDTGAALSAGAPLAVATDGFITLAKDPVSALHAVTKQYVDSVATGLDVKASVRAATTGALAAHGRVGNVLTASSNGALAAQDGVTLVLNDSLLVKDEGGGTHLENGIYTVTQVGDGSNPWILTRRSDSDTSAEVTSGMFTFISEGTTLKSQGWVLTTADPITLNTTAITFTQFTGAGEITAGNGIVKVGNTIHAFQSSAYVSGAIPFPTSVNAIGFDSTNLIWDNSAKSLTAGVVSIGSTVSRKLATRFAEQTNVLDFGALGDGTTDDATAINAAITACPSGGVVVFPVPSVAYLIASTIALNKRITLKGYGPYELNIADTSVVRVLKKSTMTTSAITVTANCAIIENISVDCQAGNTGNGIDVQANSVTLRNVCVSGAGGDGIRVGKSDTTNCNNFLLTRVRADANTGNGIYIHSSDGGSNINANGGVGSMIQSLGNGGDGLKIGNAFFNTFLGCTLESNTGYGLTLVSSTNSFKNIFMGGDVENNTTANFNLATQANGNVFLVPNTAGLGYGIGAALGLLTASPTHTLTFASTSTGIAYYNTSDQTTNYERMTMKWNSNVFQFGTEAGGTGVVRGISIIVPSSSGNINTLGTSIIFADIATTVSGVKFTTQFTPTANNTQVVFAVQTALNLTGTFNKTGTQISQRNTVTNSGTGTMATIVGQDTSYVSSAAGGATFWEAFRAVSPSLTSGSLGTSIAFYAPQQKTTGVTTGYGFYQDNSGDFNYFNGLTGLATSAPTHSLTLSSVSSGIALYNTSDQTTNLERMRIAWGSNVFEFTSEAGGGGTKRSVRINSPLTAIGATSFTPLAILHVGTGSTSVAPILITSGAGARLTTPTGGALEYNAQWYMTEGFGTTRFGLGGSIFDHSADAGNSTTTETDLYSDTIRASSLGVNATKLCARYGGTLVGHATATRQWKVYYAGTVILDTGALSIAANNSWTCYVELIRVSSTVVRYMVTFFVAGLTTETYVSVGELTGLTLSSTTVLKITGTAAGTGAATNDIVAKMGFVEWESAA